MLSLEYDEAYGDDVNQIANYEFRVRAGPRSMEGLDREHPNRYPPFTASPLDVCIATGPWFVTRVYYANPGRYANVRLCPKPVLSPRRVHGRRERKIYVNSGITFGFHHGWGSWRDRLTFNHLKRRLLKVLGVKLRPEREPPLLS